MSDGRKPVLPHALIALLGQGAKFVLVGLANTAVTLAVIFVLSGVAGANYKLANAIGYVVGLLNSFILNRIWTFRSAGTMGVQFLRFLAVFAVAYSIQFGVLLILVQSAHLDHRLSQLLAMVAYTSIGFLLSKIFVYR